METIGKPRGLIPLEDNKDCSHGLCTILCHQWCYILFSPPPPPPSFSLSDNNESSKTAFSPLVISIIGILASAFLLLCYYTIMTKYRKASILRHQDNDQQEEESVVQSQRQESWHLSAANGLDENLIAKISICFYKTGEGLIDATDCSVCLAEFRDGDTLRLLPKCNHAFHLHCIDTWLKSQSNCPLCRAGIVVQSSDFESRSVAHVLEVVEDLYLDRNGEEEGSV